MNEEIKIKWLAALRSGEYEQGTSFLKNDDRYCCLGVLCHLHTKNWETTTELYEKLDDGGPLEFLPETVRRWAELDHDSPIVRISSNLTTLSKLNDGGEFVEQHTFKQIADLIEAQL